MTKAEIEAIQTAAKSGGMYLDSIKKTDLATMTEGEWMTFVECIVMTSLDELHKKSLVDIPF